MGAGSSSRKQNRGDPLAASSSGEGAAARKAPNASGKAKKEFLGPFALAFAERVALLRALFDAHVQRDARGAAVGVDEMDLPSILASMGIELDGPGLEAAVGSLFLSGTRTTVSFEELQGWYFLDLPAPLAHAPSGDAVGAVVPDRSKTAPPRPDSLRGLVPRGTGAPLRVQELYSEHRKLHRSTERLTVLEDELSARVAGRTRDPGGGRVVAKNAAAGGRLFPGVDAAMATGDPSAGPRVSAAVNVLIVHVPHDERAARAIASAIPEIAPGCVCCCSADCTDARELGAIVSRCAAVVPVVSRAAVDVGGDDGTETPDLGRTLATRGFGGSGAEDARPGAATAATATASAAGRGDGAVPTFARILRMAEAFAKDAAPVLRQTLASGWPPPATVLPKRYAKIGYVDMRNDENFGNAVQELVTRRLAAPLLRVGIGGSGEGSGMGPGDEGVRVTANGPGVACPVTVAVIAAESEMNMALDLAEALETEGIACSYLGAKDVSTVSDAGSRCSAALVVCSMRTAKSVAASLAIECFFASGRLLIPCQAGQLGHGWPPDGGVGSGLAAALARKPLNFAAGSTAAATESAALALLAAGIQRRGAAASSTMWREVLQSGSRSKRHGGARAGSSSAGDARSGAGAGTAAGTDPAVGGGKQHPPGRTLAGAGHAVTITIAAQRALAATGAAGASPPSSPGRARGSGSSGGLAGGSPAAVSSSASAAAAEAEDPRLGHGAVLVGDEVLILGGGRVGADGRRTTVATIGSFSVPDMTLSATRRSEALGVAPRLARGASYSAVVGGKILVFGGGDHRGCTDEVFELDVRALTWARIDAGGSVPVERYGHTAVFARGRLFVMGGRRPGLGKDEYIPFETMHVLDLSTRQWSELRTIGVAPSARYRHTATLVGGHIVVVGGGRGRVPEDDAGCVYSLSLDTFEWSRWPCASPEAPAPRMAHVAATDGSRLVLFGGLAGEASHLGDTWALDLAEMSWRRMTPRSGTSTPSPRELSALVAHGSQFFLFGGGREQNAEALGDVWILELE